ncbi:MAG: phosphate/phosphite/phosphonate ABC transporter substrate-binding protein [Gammaproteobacteria bacterium]|nr:phosphate/phosphite/phosphonate ABC transporter substrate-binding protein [Gammaproteobacteria bacterium]NIR23781.1 phosphate/phosphite/phosphonate ABC transporter substrate-binding protein [Gammaproteobacteria bacterium]NIS05195.1 phosphate/phosphite/phosphonate ABC transporter substrate-binding protein [Gammaproteobacteria bacterium]NIU40831.1 phosphate/phosphite/phosphonate ABC transporter substrate-binding protein [Gammaproteobacteria bacterium]NIV47720.1 phosphate/phosphite/phosphonate 
MTTPKMLLTAVAAVLTLGMASWASAAECPYRGTLDAQYCDRNRDLIADLPMNESEWVNPDTIIFSYTPVEDPAVYAKVWDEFINHMSKVTGKKVVFFPVQSYAAQYEAMRSGRLHVAGVNTGGNPVAVSCAGFVPFASMSREGKVVGYEMEIIVPAGSAIKTPADLKGKTLAFTSPTSNSGFKAPSALLKSEFGMVADKDFKTTFSGKHDNSILGVANKDYEAAAIANSVLHRMLDRGVVKKDQYRTVYTSQTFPTTGYGYAHNLHPAVAEKIKQAFFTFDWNGTSLQNEFGKQADGFVAIYHKQDWDVIRKIDTANGVTYKCK